MQSISVVTTTWNEKENIQPLITKIHQVLKNYPHEIIIIDDNSTDGTIHIAKQHADIAITKPRQGQTKGLLDGMQLAKYPTIITIDADLENDPKHIPQLATLTSKFGITIASRTKLPRISEKLASKTLGKLLGVTDTFSNYRAFKKTVIPLLKWHGGETFGAEFLITAKKNHLKIGQITYTAPPRRQKPRIGGTIKANLRILWALLKCLTLYSHYKQTKP